ncbi:MAG: ABC transporter ATP-binding protein [Actinobacteria bacterium]|nr:ABC transporter ATP-binding protein [Actinomycetota bacterium]
MALLEVSRLDAGYGDFQALFGIDVHVGSGETVAFIGANGAGKSTLLRTIVGTVERTRGDVRFDGESVVDVPTHRRLERGIALVPEGRRVFPSLNVEENLLVGAYSRRPGPWSVDRVFDLFPFLGRRRSVGASNLSGGEQQALAIGRALMSNPALLLLDEVSLGLAPVIVKGLYAAMPAVKEEGTTVVLVEQDIGQALAAADRVYCLLEGAISLHGRPADLVRDDITAAYFGV